MTEEKILIFPTFCCMLRILHKCFYHRETFTNEFTTILCKKNLFAMELVQFFLLWQQQRWTPLWWAWPWVSWAWWWSVWAWLLNLTPPTMQCPLNPSMGIVLTGVFVLNLCFAHPGTLRACMILEQPVILDPVPLGSVVHLKNQHVSTFYFS